MIPKKPKEIIKILSEELDIPQSMIDDIVTLYYKELRKSLSNLEGINYKAPGLGNFIIRGTGLKKAIKKFEGMDKGMDTSTFMLYHNKRLVAARLEKLYKANEMFQEYLEKKKAFKDKRNGNTKGHLEEQETNS